MELTATVWIDPVAIQPWLEEENRLRVATRPFSFTGNYDELVNRWNNELFILYNFKILL